ncbi:hypothetical protein GCM10018789_58380 [Streptomyces werraensis]|nr:hypothetical protein GCM10018789_58380 [Streptomyces werraensis]
MPSVTRCRTAGPTLLPPPAPAGAARSTGSNGTADATATSTCPFGSSWVAKDRFAYRPDRPARPEAAESTAPSAVADGA